LDSRRDLAWFGQPRGLTILFGTEMWEKFSYYGMRAILVYYMIKALHFGVAKASLIYGLYTALVYFTPILGGIVADRWMGKRRAVVVGGLIMAAGHFMLTFEPLFYPALAAIALGNGLYLPSLPSQIAGLYGEADPRRAGAYNVYYVGVNLGGFLAPLACGFLGETYGWHYGFAAAGIGMCLGVTVFVSGFRWLPPEPPRTPKTVSPPKRTPFTVRTALLLLATGVAVVIFRGAYEQMGNSVALWIDEDVNRHVGRFLIPASWFQSLDPLLIFLFTPVFVWVWSRAAARGRDTAPLTRMMHGALGLALAFAFLAAVTLDFAHLGARPSWIWPTLFITVYTAAELFILPTGLGLFARLAPRGLGATTIAAWFFAAFAGNLLAGALGTFWPRVNHAVFFGGLAALALVAAGVLAALRRPAMALDSTG
jgi:POT family proton-dependent oligopeptide transporter